MEKTIGPLVDQPTHLGPWNYASSDGMGLLEMLEWCEDLKIEPVLAVYAGYSLNGEHVTGKTLKPFIEDALEEIEYVTGDARTTKWGAVRAKNGHSAPFPLHYVEIGNEDGLNQKGEYDDRFEPFAQAIRAKYPQLRLIATTPVKKGNPDLIDDHYYKTSEEFFAMVHYYDKVDRKGPKIFVGEWATRMGTPTPNFAGALGDAAWMTGMERNSDLIELASYAPLLVNVNPGAMQWDSDLIGYDALQSYGSPSYWAQVMFAGHLGDQVVKTSADAEPNHFFWSATVSSDKRVLCLKLVNASENEQPLTLQIPVAKDGSVNVTALHAAAGWATNTIENPRNIVPVTSTVSFTANEWKKTVPANTIEVLDIPLQ